MIAFHRVQAQPAQSLSQIIRGNLMFVRRVLIILRAVASGFCSVRRSVGFCVVLFLFSSALLAGDDSRINVNSLKKLVKDKDKAVAYTATAQLAAYYRREGDLKKAEKLLQDFSSPSGFDRLPAKVAIPYLRCLLENAHIKALQKDLPGSLQLLNWAERRKRDYERAFSCLKYAEILLDLAETERAQAYLKNVNQILAKHINETAASGGAIGQGSKTLDTQGSWRTLRDQADHLALEIEEVQLSKKFGATYASYVKLRRLQKIVKRSKAPRYFNEAIKLCDDIAETDPQSQFAAAAGYLKGQLLLNNPAEDPKKSIKDAKDHLGKFIKSNPEGLYRGEAMMLLGKISLEKEWNAKDAEKYYSQALNWFKQARERRDAMSLYAPMSNDLKTQTKATQRPTTLNKWKRTVYHEEDPLRLYNTASSPTWYASDKEKNCLFMLGFCKFINNDYTAASKFWTQAGRLDPGFLELNAARLPNAMKRLLAACKVGYMAFTRKEKEQVKNKKNQLLLAYAELNYILARFDQAIDFYRQILNSPKSNQYEKALANMGIGACLEIRAHQGYKKEAEKYFKRVLDNKELKKSEIYGSAMARCAYSVLGTYKGYNKAIDMYEYYIKNFPDGRYNTEARYHRICCYLQMGKNDKARRLYRKDRFEERWPNSGYTEDLQDMFKRIDNKGK